MTYETSRSLLASPRGAWLSFAGGIAMIYVVAVWLAMSPYMLEEPRWIGTGIALDLTLTATFVFWLTLVRTERVSSLLMTPFLLLSAGAAWWLLADRVVSIESTLIAIVLVAEAGAALLLLVNLGRVIRVFRRMREGGAGFEQACSEAMLPVLKSERVTELVVTEASLLYYGVCGFWQKAAEPAAGTRAFSYHVENGSKAIAIGLSLLVVVEIIPVHVLLAAWNPTVALIVTGLSVYSLVWMVGDYHAMRLTPVLVGPEKVEIRMGRRWSVDIALAAIAGVTRVYDKPEEAPGLVDISSVGGPDVLIEVEREHEIRGLFGIRKSFFRLAMPMDDPEGFVEAVEAARAGEFSGTRTDRGRDIG